MSATESTALSATTRIFQGLTTQSQGGWCNFFKSCCHCFKREGGELSAATVQEMSQLSPADKDVLINRLKWALLCVRLKQTLAVISIPLGIVGFIGGFLIGASQQHHIPNPGDPVHPTVQTDNQLIVTGGLLLSTVSVAVAAIMPFYFCYLSSVAKAYSAALETMRAHAAARNTGPQATTEAEFDTDDVPRVADPGYCSRFGCLVS